MKGIGGADAPGKRQAGQECLGHWDLIGFLRDRDLQERFLALVGTEGEQVRSGLLVRSGTAHRFAIQGNRVLCLGHESAAYPISQSPFDLLSI
jgi:hypothetical protein